MDIIVSCGNHASLLYWGIKPFKCFGTVENAHREPIRVIIPYQQNMFITGSHDSDISVWKSGKSVPVMTFKGHRNRIQTLCLINEFHKSRYLVSGSRDDDIRVWHIGEGKCKSVIKTDHGGITSVAELSSTTVASVGKDFCLNIWDLEGRSIPRIHRVDCRIQNRQMRGYHYTPWYCTGIDVDLSQNILFSISNEIIIWDLMNMKQIYAKGNAGNLTCLKYIEDRKLLIIGDTDGNIQCLDTRKLPKPDPNDFEINSDDLTVWKTKKHLHWTNQITRIDYDTICTCADDGLIIKWNLSTGKAINGVKQDIGSSQDFVYGVCSQRIFDISLENREQSIRDHVERSSFVLRNVEGNFGMKMNSGDKEILVFKCFLC